MAKKKKYSLPELSTGKSLLKVSGSLAVLIIIFAILEITNTTHILHKQKVPAVIPIIPNSSTRSNNQPATSQSNSSTAAPTPTEKTQQSSAGSNQDLIAPFGDFVSNHSPGTKDSNGNVTPTAETSTCDTTPGATCYIKFTNVDTGQSTQLPTQTAGLDGSTTWNWDVNKAHLTSGEWQIAAVASLSGQTKSTNDDKLIIQ